MHLQEVQNYPQDLPYLKLFPVINKLVTSPLVVKLIVVYHLLKVTERDQYDNIQGLRKHYCDKIEYIMTHQRKNHHKSQVNFL